MKITELASHFANQFRTFLLSDLKSFFVALLPGFFVYFVPLFALSMNGAQRSNKGSPRLIANDIRLLQAYAFVNIDL